MRVFLDTNIFLYSFLDYDALMLSSAEVAACDVIFTEDLNDGEMYGTVKTVNPFKGM